MKKKARERISKPFVTSSKANKVFWENPYRTVPGMYTYRKMSNLVICFKKDGSTRNKSHSRGLIVDLIIGYIIETDCKAEALVH